MKLRVMATTLWLVFVVFIGSDIVKAEFLTDIKLSPDKVYPDQHNIINITNSGFLQADNVIVLLTADDNTVAGFSGECVEGKISIFDKKTLTVEFSRMSPDLPCTFDLEVYGPTSLNYRILADDRPNPTTLWQILFVIISTTILALIFLVKGYITYLLFKKEISWSLYSLDKHKHKIRIKKNWKEFKLSDNAKEIARAVDERYGLSINSVDATILEHIYAGKITLAELTHQTHVSRWHINTRITILVKRELLSSDKKSVQGSLTDYFDGINKMSGGSTTD